MAVNGHDPAHEQTETFWLAYLAYAMGAALKLSPEIARSHLRDALNTFKRSGVCSDNLRNHLKGD